MAPNSAQAREPTATAAELLLPQGTGVTLYWLPLGAGGHCVSRSGRVFEALAARHERRAARDLYHSALEVRVCSGRWTIEMTPAWSGGHTERGVVREGPVGSRLLGRSVLFRYEVRRWRDGVIPDVREAVAGSRRVSADGAVAERLLELVPMVPVFTWGRDEAGAGEMWNSNSLTAWLLARTGHRMDRIAPPAGGRAPGWSAGLVVAARDERNPGRPAAKA
jgi:hypothetical protein